MRAIRNAFVSLIVLSGCATRPETMVPAQVTMAARVQAEPPGNYFIGRRYYKPDYHFWGYIRQPGQRWSTAQLVVMNENRRLTPDREQLAIGSDNDCEYELYGYFSGDKVYELVSNQFLPEFVLQDYKLISTQPLPIFKSQFPGHQKERVKIERPL